MNAKEKMIKYGAGALSPADLISVVIGGKNADTVAENIAEYIGDNIRDSVDATPEEFKRFDGIGENKALAIVAMIEFAKRLECETQRIKPSANNPESIAAIARGKLIHQKQEHVLAILCNAKMECESVETVAIGGLSQCLADPREIFYRAVRKRAAAIVLVHNHPSGCCEPSQDDINLTRRCIEAGNVLGIKLVDHVIISDTGYKSLRFSEMYDLDF